MEVITMVLHIMYPNDAMFYMYAVQCKVLYPGQKRAIQNFSLDPDHTQNEKHPQPWHYSLTRTKLSAEAKL